MNTTSTLKFEGYVSGDRTRSYWLVPFSVPENTARIDVSYTCDPDYTAGLEPDENPQDYIADFAIFDPRGAEFMGKGFRGTSGNTLSSIFIATDQATRGYYAGPIPAGEWNIMLAFYKLGPSGCSYRVNVTFTSGQAVAAETPARIPLSMIAPRPANATGWYKGELHCHTFHSDGDSSPEDVVRMAEKLGLDFLSITDHNTFTQQMALCEVQTDLILIPGCEVTTMQGHWNTWGDGGPIEFRITNPAEMTATIAEAVRQHYLTSCNHPRPNGPAWMFPDVEGYACVEVWNGTWENLNHVCLDFWETQIKQGKRLVAVGGSDCHELMPTSLAHPTTYIYCPGEPSAARILDALRAGHAFVTRGPDGSQLYLQCGGAMMGDVIAAPESGSVSASIRVIDGEGMVLELYTSKGLAGTSEITTTLATVDLAVVVSGALYIRAQLRDPKSGNVTAITNPIYLEKG